MTDAAERIGWLERAGDDFPYYDGRPVAISARGWWLVMASIAVAFVILTAPIPAFAGLAASFIPAILFFAIPLATLALVAPRGWTAIFRRIRAVDILLMIGFALLNIVVTGITGLILIAITETTLNPGVVGLASEGVPHRIVFFLKTIPQLFGEELLTILPFLALISWLTASRGIGRNRAVVIAWLLVSVLFAAAHLPTYGWNIVQVLGGVGIARLVLTLAYIMTKNIWVSTGAHICSDWILFGASLAIGGLGQ